MIVPPTELSSLPRFREMIHRHFVGEVIQRSVGRDDEDIRAEVMAEMRRNFLGDRLCMISTGSAPTTPEVKDFISVCFQLPINALRSDERRVGNEGASTCLDGWSADK